MTWGFHCSMCGREDCSWARGDTCEGLERMTPPTPKQLAPCPFCGGKAMTVKRKNSWIVGCIECPASVEDDPGHEGHEGMRIAVARWNRRVERAAKDDDAP